MLDFFNAHLDIVLMGRRCVDQLQVLLSFILLHVDIVKVVFFVFESLVQFDKLEEEGVARLVLVKVAIEAHEGPARVQHCFQLLEVVLRVSFGYFYFDIGLPLVHSDDEVNHDAVDAEIPRDDRDVAEFRCEFD